MRKLIDVISGKTTDIDPIKPKSGPVPLGVRAKRPAVPKATNNLQTPRKKR